MLRVFLAIAGPTKARSNDISKMINCKVDLMDEEVLFSSLKNCTKKTDTPNNINKPMNKTRSPSKEMMPDIPLAIPGYPPNLPMVSWKSV